MKKKSISLLLTLALIISLFVGVTVPASAAPASSDYWTDYNGNTLVANYDTSWYSYSSSGTTFTLYDAADLAGLAAIVNGTAYKTNASGYLIDASDSTITEISDAVSISADTFSDDIIELSSSINTAISLSAHYWTPIGGMWNSNSGVPSGHYFAGVFNGNGKSITGMYINLSKSGVGLFGYVYGGIIANLTVAGEITTGAYAAVGGIVGYTNGSLINCTSNVDVTSSSANSSNLGGLAGIVENTVSLADLNSRTRATVRDCTSTGNVKGGKRIGGLIGGAYSTATGAIYVDRCKVSDTDTTDHDVWTLNSAFKTFIGGLIGYCEASVSNCLVDTNINVYAPSNGGHRMGGVAGVLSGYYSAKGNIAKCVFLGTITNYNSNTSYDGALCVAESGTTVVNSFYYTGYASQSTTGATGVYDLSVTQMQNNGIIADSKKIGDFLSAVGIPSWKIDYYNEWTCTIGSVPQLNQSSTVIDSATLKSTYGTGSTSFGNDDGYTTKVYYDAAADSAGSGTFSAPYNNFATAVGALTSNTVVLCVQSPISVTDYTTYASSLSGKTIGRSYIYSGPIFEVKEGETLTLSGVTLDGNSTTEANQSLIIIGEEGDANTASVILNSGTTLQYNNSVSRDSAVRVESGSLTMNTGAVIANNTSRFGGIVFVKDGATFSYAGSGIAAGQIVYLANTPGTSDAYVTLSATPSVILTIRMANPGDSIKAVGGDGTYTVTSATTPMISAPGYLVLLGTNQITLSEIYLNTGAGTNGTGTSASPFNSLTTAVSNAASTGAPIHVVNGISISSSTTISDDVSFIGPSGSTMFTVASGGTLTLSGNVKLTGCGTAVSVSYGGTFAMSNGSIIGNTTSGNGGGVYVNGGTFTMTGGTITGNSATNGGAVYIGSGTFTMNGGTISGNTATLGAGVYVTAGSTFSLGCSGIASSDVIYLSNSNGNSDAYITLTVSLTNKISIQCANPNPGSSGTRIVFGSTSTIISSDTLSNISCPGYSLSRKTNATPKYIYISGIAS